MLRNKTFELYSVIFSYFFNFLSHKYIGFFLPQDVRRKVMVSSLIKNSFIVTPKVQQALNLFCFNFFCQFFESSSVRFNVQTYYILDKLLFNLLFFLTNTNLRMFFFYSNDLNDLAFVLNTMVKYPVLFSYVKFKNYLMGVFDFIKLVFLESKGIFLFIKLISIMFLKILKVMHYKQKW